MKIFKYIALGFLLILSDKAIAQIDEYLNYSMEDDQVRVELDRSCSPETTAQILEHFGFSVSTVDSLWQGAHYAPSSFSWNVEDISQGAVSFVKRMSDLRSEYKHLGGMVFEEDWFFGVSPDRQVSFGFNANQMIDQRINGEEKAVFRLEGHVDAKQVILSGSFSEWCETCLPMHRVDGGWEREVLLSSGKHAYKFIVDNEWINDDSNPHTEANEFGGVNNLVYRANTVFHLNGSYDAYEVYLAGNFNNWEDDTAPMYQTREGWQLSAYLKDGNYEYRYVVDDEWQEDPSNPDKVTNEFGEYNSRMVVGKTTHFFLDGFEMAQEVHLTGNFNHWNKHQLKVKRSYDGWEIDYVLDPGNYEYLFIVDGKEVLDPSNSAYTGKGQYKNSLLVVEPNHTFSLDGYAHASDVLLAGSFTNWEGNGLSMSKVGDAWQIDVHVPKGKNRYKFVVDGEWVKDPSNALWEDNEFNDTEGNSVLWK